MSSELSQALMVQYFETMNSHDDIGRHMSDDVVWTTVESGEQVRGREAVTDHIRALHAKMSDMQTRTFAVTDQVALVEGDCVPASGSGSGDQAPPAERVPYAVVYDIALGRIAEMRLYMQVSRLLESGRAD